MDGFICIFLIGITIIAEIYLALFVSVQYLYGMDYFLSVFIMLGLPAATLLYAGNMIRKKIESAPRTPKPTARSLIEEPLIDQQKEELAELQNYYRNTKVSPCSTKFYNFVDRCVYQLSRYEKKKLATLALLDSDAPTLNKEKCRLLLKSTEDIFLGRVGAFLRSADLFDEKEYSLFLAKRLDLDDDGVHERKLAVYNNLFENMELVLDGNEVIILRLDELAATINNQHTGKSWDMDAKISLYKLDQTISSTNESIEIDKATTETAVAMWAELNGIQ